MAIQNPHSTLPGHMPHLTPGEIGVNKADDTLWFRSEGRRVPVVLSSLTRAPPLTGYTGSPLGVKDGKPIWDKTLAPSCVVAGAIHVDLPPGPGLVALPGVYLSGLGADRGLAANDVEVTPFYVRSDSIAVTHLAFSVKSASPPAMRVGIVDALGIVQVDMLVSSPVVGGNTVAIGADVVLERGQYRTVLCPIGGGVTVGVVSGARQEQGWDLVSGIPSFIRSYSGVKNMASGIGSLPSLTARRSGAPGQDQSVLLRWH